MVADKMWLVINCILEELDLVFEEFAETACNE